MIVFIISRIVTCLYGYSWPLRGQFCGSSINSFLAYWSFVEMQVEIFGLIALAVHIVINRGKKDEH